MKKHISVIIPIFNEEKNIPLVHDAVTRVLQGLPDYTFELIFVNDGSDDGSADALEALSEADPNSKYVEFSRNFGKEMATTAGLFAAQGDAVIMIDADLQHPPKYIPHMLAAWERGAEVVVGVRSSNAGEGFVKKYGSLLFYHIIGSISETSFTHGETDFRLIDRSVVEAFKSFPEHQRMTRSLINWLGFRRETIAFDAPARLHGKAQYSTFKLVQLALNSFLSHSLLPLRLAGYLGVTITLGSFLLGVAVFAERYIFNDYFSWHVSGAAQLAIISVFLSGISLMCLGIIALYIGSIHTEVSGRPLYVVRKKKGVQGGAKAVRSNLLEEDLI